MASYQIKDMHNPKRINDWIIYPLVYKLYNARGEGDYKTGLMLDIMVKELAHLPLLPIGDADDPLIATAVCS